MRIVLIEVARDGNTWQSMDKPEESALAGFPTNNTYPWRETYFYFSNFRWGKQWQY